jgi:LCP family protein required for cell wall assembly
VLAKALAGVFVIFIATGAGVAGAGYFQIPVPKPDPSNGPLEPPIPGIPDDQIAPPVPGSPRTLLVLGSDRRAKNSVDNQLSGQAESPHSDTIVLVRLDPKRNRIAVLSLPRDLAVTIPGYADNTKINQAYDEGGAAKTLETVKYLFENATGEKFPVNSVVDVSFNGFQQAVNYVKGVYVDVDRDYHNPEGTGFAAIDIKAGYQRLVGSDALAYVRYRHTDSDIFRNARQQEFLRQASNQPSVEKLKSADSAQDFLNNIIGYFRFDKKFLTRKNIAGLIKTGVSLAYNHAPVNQIALDGITEAENPLEDTRLYISNENVKLAFDAFMTGEGTSNPTREKKAKKVKKATKASSVTGLENARRLGENLAVLASRRLKTLPFYFPEYRTTGSRYDNETPRIYSERDEQGQLYRAYRIVIYNGAPGEYYGVQGQTWRDPPLLANPDRIREVNGRKLMLFYDGSKLRQVAWRTSRAVYWVTNTLNRKLSNPRMIAIAGSLRRLGS